MKQTIRQYALKQSAVTGVCTVILCAIIYAFLVKTDVAFSTTLFDLSTAVGSTGLVCALFQVFLSKGPVEKGKVPPVGRLEDQAAYVLVPKNCVIFLVELVAMELIVFSFAAVGVFSAFAVGGTIPRFWYLIIKTLLVGFAASYSTYHTNVFVCGLRQEKLAADSRKVEAKAK